MPNCVFTRTHSVGAAISLMELFRGLDVIGAPFPLYCLSCTSGTVDRSINYVLDAMILGVSLVSQEHTCFILGRYRTWCTAMR